MPAIAAGSAARASPESPVSAIVAARGASRIACDAVEQVTRIVEAMHANIAAAPGPLSRQRRERTRGLTGLVYSSIRLVNKTTRATLDGALGLVAKRLGPSLPQPQADHALAALNGVIGDYLEATGNPLAIPLQLRCDAQPVAAHHLGDSRKLLVIVHGLCMNDRQWTVEGQDHAAALAREIGCTPVHLLYNTGRHISENGRDFADRLEQLLQLAPQPVEELIILGHSMGGLVARSACHHGSAAGHAWLEKLRTLVFLGTPHHGAPLERGGHWLQALGGMSPYTAPLARLAMLRSAGVTDLRHGSLRDEDWRGMDRFGSGAEPASHVPLPAGVRAYALAATLAAEGSSFEQSLVGDGLVPLPSALGRHLRRAKSLRIPRARQWVGYGMSHFDLLHRPEVFAQVRAWLTSQPTEAG